MAQATTVRYGAQQLLVSDNATVPVFTAPCGITSLTRQITANTSDVDIPDCGDPDAFTWLGIDVNSKRMTLTFSGVLATEAMELWDDWAMEDASRDCRWYRNLTSPLKGYWAGSGILTEFQEQGQNKGRYQVSGTIIFDGKPVWTTVA